MRFLFQDLRYAARSLRRSPLVSCFIVVTLAICIGAVATVYSVADVVLIKALPYERPDQLLWIASVSPDRPDRPFTLPEFMDYRTQAKSVRIGGYTSWSGILETTDGAERLQGLRMSGDALEILGASPTIGRLLVPDDDAPGAPRVIVLGYGYWRREFAGNGSIVGKTLPVNGEPYTVVGVLPRFLPLPSRDIDAVVPLDPERDPRRNERNSVNFLRLIGRTEGSTTTESARRELNAIQARLKQQFPSEYVAKIGVETTPLQDYLGTTLRPTLVILLWCVALMVAVALANVLNLLLARAVSRQGETAVRLALGASGPRIALQLLTEGALLATLAAVLGSWFAHLVISYGATHLGTIAPRIEEAQLDTRVLGIVIAVCALAVLLFSLVSILVARTTSPGIVLRGAGRSGGSSPAQARLRSSFVVAEVALALIITSAAAALFASLMSLERVELGFRPDSVFVARLSLPPLKYENPADLGRFATAMGSALAAAPGVEAAGGSSIAPLTGLFATVPSAPGNHPPADRREWPQANYRAVSPGYLEAIGAHLLTGRTIAARDDNAGLPVAVVNRTLAQGYFEGEDPIGLNLLIDDNNTGPRPVMVVGVVDDLRDVELDAPVRPEVFISLAQIHPDAASLATATQFWAIRLKTDPKLFAPTFLRLLRKVDPAVASAGTSELRSYVDAAIAPRRFSVRLLTTFTLIALLLTTLGVYGISAYAVEQRRREIGVRLALGATSDTIVRLMLARTLKLAGLGVVLGLVGAYLTSGFLARVMFGITPGSPLLLGAASLVLLVTALVASWLPGRKAGRVDVVKALSE